MQIYRAEERGKAEHGWLHSRFSFSFDAYRNPDRMGFGGLRGINDDVVEPGKGFDMHPHRDMEIITIVTKGMVEHKDSEGHHGITAAGQIQYMSAGSGIFHSEYNPSASEPLELFQVWIRPNVHNLPPHYDQRDFSDFDETNKWVFLVSPDGRKNSMAIRQDAFIMTAFLESGSAITSAPLQAEYGRLLLVVEGEVTVNGKLLNPRDEVQLQNGEAVVIEANRESRLLMFEVPMSR
jgi:redox-sensitive bicupin YhaK (pirin superfamily)